MLCFLLCGLTLPTLVVELVISCEQATVGNSGSRELNVEVYLAATSFLVVRDNGAGMDAVGLENLATYFRTQVLYCTWASGERAGQKKKYIPV